MNILNDQLTLLIDQAQRTTTFDPVVAAKQKEPVLAAMTRAGYAFTALHLDDTGCVVL